MLYGTVDKEHFAFYFGDDEQELEMIAQMLYMALMVEVYRGGEVEWSLE
jgi:hypothetical protein